MNEDEAGLKFEERGLSAVKPFKFFTRTFEEPRLIKLHYHSSLEINVCRNIHGHIRFPGGDLDLSEDCITILPPGIPHSYNLLKSDGVIDVYHFLLPAMPGADESLCGKLNSISVSAVKDEYIRLLNELRHSNASVMKITGILLLLMDSAAGSDELQPASAAVEDSFLFRVIKYAEQNYYRRLTLDEISRQAGVSRFHFSRLFMRKSGQNWSSYLRNLRLNRSLRLLQDGNSVADTASESGFESDSYYIRCFREEYGVTPRQWINEIRKN